MSGEIEAAGAAITAGLAARAIDGQSGHAHGAAGGACLNCSATLQGAYCHACGQSGHIERKLTHVFEEFLHGIVHFDTKAWRTLPLLIARPGTLTYEYIRGKRARFVSPLATFLFVVFMMFFVFALFGGVQTSGPATLPDLRAEAASVQSDLTRAESDAAAARAALAKLEARGATVDADRLADAKDAVTSADEDVADTRKSLAAIQGKIDRRAEILAQLKAARAQLDVNEAKAKAANDTEALNDIAIAKGVLDAALSRPDGPPDGVTAQVAADGDVDVSVEAGREDTMETIFSEIKKAEAAGKITVNTGSKKLDEKIHAKLRNPELGWYKIQNTAYKFSFLLVPLSLPFVAFLFLFKKDVTLYDHVVFILYSLSFMSLLFLTLLAIGRLAPGLGEPLGLVGVVAPPVHMFFQLGGTYRLKLFSALWRTVMLCVFAGLALSIFIALIIVLGLTG